MVNFGLKLLNIMKRRLGNSDLYVAPLAFGGNVFGWTVNEADSFRLMDAFVEGGGDLIDTADSYSHWAPGNKGGESETIIGKWMKTRGNRNKVVLATKVGSAMGTGKKDISKKYILWEVEQSLMRLQTDHIDLYQTHWDDNVTPVEETLEAYAQLVREGKVRWIGASNLSPERLKASLEASRKHGYPRYETLQPLYNLYEREVFERDYEPVCREHNISVITYYSLASGFLTGKYRSEDDLAKSARGQGIKKYLTERGMRILQALDEVARQYKTTPAAVALAWLMARPTVAAPIASATDIEQLHSLLDAVKLELDAGAMGVLEEGSRY
jgi:aryl-alcohol dehydrogenase-like predicted oxidoreductase